MAADDDSMRRRAVADLVRHQRGLTGLTVVDAARQAGIGRSTWTDLESGQSPIPKADTLGKVAKVLTIDAGVLLAAAGYGSPNIPSPASAETEVMRLIADIGDRLSRIEERLEQLDADAQQRRSRPPQRDPRPASPTASR